MKKLDNNILRKLILETLEGSSELTEGKKKKRMKEVQPVPEADEESPVNPEQDVAHGMESEPQPGDFGMETGQGGSVTPEEVAEALEKALELKSSPNKAVAASGEDLVNSVFKQFKDAHFPSGKQ